MNPAEYAEYCRANPNHACVSPIQPGCGNCGVIDFSNYYPSYGSYYLEVVIPPWMTGRDVWIEEWNMYVDPAGEETFLVQAPPAYSSPSYIGYTNLTIW